MSLDPGLEQQLYRSTTLASEIRGRFLEHAIAIEVIVADIVALHFCPKEDVHNLFYSLVMNAPDFTFKTKIEILEKLLKLRYRDLLQRYPTLIGELHKVRRFRNRLAHSMLDATEKFLRKGFTDRIQLVYYEDDRAKQQVIKTADNNERLSASSQLLRHLIDVQKEVAQRAQAAWSVKQLPPSDV